MLYANCGNPSAVEPEEDVINDLRMSRKLVGELLPVIKDQKGRILNGRHRKLAGWRSEVVLPVKDDLDFYIKRLHFLVQRKASIAEQAESIRLICEELSKRGMPDDQIMEHVVTKISPWGRSWTYELIPDRFKREHKQYKIHSVDFQDRPVMVGGVEVSPSPLPSERDSLEWPCHTCGCPEDWRSATWPRPSAPR